MKTKIWAHRGASAYAPENTMEAFELAAKQGADGIELDVQLTLDGEMIVMHDESLARTTGQDRLVRDCTLEEIRLLHANRTHPEYTEARIPLLAEVLDFLSANDMTLNIELKNGVVDYPGLEEKVLKLVTSRKMEGRVIFSSFNHKSIRQVQKLNSHVRTGILYSDGFLKVPAYAQQLGVTAIHPAIWHAIGTPLIKKCHEKNIKVHVWTVDQENEIMTLLEKKADAIITNKPDIARRISDCYYGLLQPFA